MLGRHNITLYADEMERAVGRIQIMLKGDIEDLRALIAKESWMSAEKAAEIFNIAIIDEIKDVNASLGRDILDKFGYKHVPEQLIKKPEIAPAQTPAQATNQPDATPEPVDYTEWENRINMFRR